MKNLDVIVSETIRKYKGTMEELADKLGVKASTLYRLANPYDEATINSKHLIPLMEVTKNYEILKHIALRCGYVCVKLPRVKSKRTEEIAEYQKRQALAIKAIVEFFEEGGAAEQAINLIRDEIEYAAGFKLTIENQPMLFEEETDE